MRRTILTLIALAVLAFAAGPRAAAAETVGVVVMHGMDAKPPYPTVSGFVRSLAAAGFLVDDPEMPWSARRGYDVDYDRAMSEIDASVARLKARGATAIVICGHSLGGNAALGYGARHKGLKAVVALAPGHSVDTPSMQAITAESLAKAKAMVAAGRGEESDSFADRNHGVTFQRQVRARIYLNYFDPEGPAAMARNAAKLSAPLLTVVGERDPLSKFGPDYFFTKAPANPHNRYLSVAADHMGTPTAAVDQVIEWLKGL